MQIIPSRSIYESLVNLKGEAREVAEVGNICLWL